MNCKFCNAQWEEETTLCPVCGKDNAEEILEEAEVIAEEAAEEATEEAVLEVAEEVTEEAAPAKKKAKWWVIALAIVCAVALVAVLVGAVLYGTGAFGEKTETYTVSDDVARKERETVIATVGNAKLTNSELQIYYWQSVSDFTEYYGTYMDISTLGLDLEQPLSQQFYDEEEGITWEEYFLENALNTWSRYAALSNAAEEAAFTLDEESLAYLESVPEQLEMMASTYGYLSAKDMLEADMSVGCDMDGYMRFLRTNFYAGQYFDSLYTTFEPTLDEIQAYYDENADHLATMGIADDGSRVVDVRHILVCPVGGTESAEGDITYSDAEWETCRQSAQALLDQWKAGAATEESFAQMAVEHTEDPGSMSTGGLYTDVYLGQMVPPFEDWCFDASRQYGDTGLVQTDYGYHIMYFVASEEVWIKNVRSTMVNEASTTFISQLNEKWPMEVDYDKIVLGAATAE